MLFLHAAMGRLAGIAGAGFGVMAIVTGVSVAVPARVAAESSHASAARESARRTTPTTGARADEPVVTVPESAAGDWAAEHPLLPVGVAVLELMLLMLALWRWRQRSASRRPVPEAGVVSPAHGGDGEAEMQRLAAEFFSGAGSGVDRDLTTAVMGAIGDALIIVDRDGVIRKVNQATCDLLGYAQAALVGRPVDEIVLAGDDVVPEWRTQTVLRDVTVRYLTHDRQVLPMSLSMAPVRDPAGHVLGTIGVARDMRDRLRLMDEVEQARDTALELSRIKSDFLANMSHEIRTPMNAIIGYTDIALETEVTSAQRGYLDAVRRAAVALLGIINEVLDFSRIEAGKLTLEKLPFSLRDVVQETLRTLAVRADEKGLELGCHLERGVPDGVIGDPNRLRQVLVNLIGNAIKFTAEGQVVVRVGLDAAPAADAVMLHFAVQDSGIGIAADKLDLIFHPFTQADGSMSRTYGGTGLGLAIATQLVELMGGRIRVESTVGQGSVFHFTMHAGLSGDESRAMTAELPQLHGVRALLVEDNTAMNAIGRDLLASFGLRVTTTTDATAARVALTDAVAEGDPFGLIVSDVGLPGTDGFELVEAVQGAGTLRATPIVLLGQATRPKDVARSRALGVGFLTKPVTAAELLEAVCAAREIDPQVLAEAGVAGTRPAPLRVLVAEDQALNRRMVAILLEQRGHTVVAVSDGHEAVEAVRNDAFDVVLMDLQMPGMDGVEAAQAIRAWQEGRAVRVPIVALTGHALPGDRERCLRAGMDGFLTKPIDAAALFAILDRLAPHAVAPAATTLAGLPPTVIDPETLLARVAGNRQAVAEIVTLFREDTRALRAETTAALESRDGDALERAAARFAGSFRVIAAPAAVAAATDLQEKAHQRDFHRAREVWADLSRELDRLEPALQTLLASDALAGGDPAH